MKARLMALPDELRGGAWPSPVRAVRCPVKSGNERDPHPYLPADPVGMPGTIGELLAIVQQKKIFCWIARSQRKGRATAGQYKAPAVGK